MTNELPKLKIPAHIYIIAILMIIVSTTLFLYWSNKTISVSEYTIVSETLPQEFDGFKIVQVSDLHNARFGKDNKRLLKKIEAQNPDMIAITGDLVDCRRTNISIALDFVEKAMEIAPCYYVCGNHERWIEDRDGFFESLKNLGVIVLADESFTLYSQMATINIIGLTDPDFKKYSDVTDIINELPSESYTVLLAHRPELFESYAKADIDLVLSGHAHGGQFRLPFLGGIFAPEQGFFPKYDSGLYTKGTCNMIVSRGLGNSLFPFRINNRPEIISITLST